MNKIHYHGKSCPNKPGETVLESLLRANINVTFSCRSGICQTCMLKATKGKPSEKSTRNLSPQLQEKGYFLPCKCLVEQDMEVELPVKADLYSRARVVEKSMLSPSVLRLIIHTATPLYYHAGQYINLRRPDGLMRSYSLASLPQRNAYLEIHVRLIEGGAMSGWLNNSCKTGDTLDFQGPLGSMYYKNEFKRQDLVLIGTGTGLAPLQGIVEDALNNQHQGNIYLYHGASTLKDLYNESLLQVKANEIENFHYIACVSSETDHDYAKGRANDIAFARHSDLRNAVVFLAGNPDMVYAGFEQAIAQGAEMSQVLADPFEFSDVSQAAGPAIHFVGEDDTAADIPQERPEKQLLDPPYPEPDPEMWAALENGKLLRKIMVEFYEKVFADPSLNGYFKESTQNRAAEKQYNFLYKVFTGEKVYFGEKPKNAHNWMVISTDLFDYREKIMEDTLRENHLPEHLIKRWMEMEYRYKPVIVKDTPWSKMFDGVELPVDGFDELITECSALCDGCGGEIGEGERATYHLRIGKMYCQTCKQAS